MSALVPMLTSPPAIGLVAAVRAMWIRLIELYHGRGPGPAVVDPRSFAVAVALVEQLAPSTDPADRDAAYLLVLAITRWLHRELRRSREPSQRIARAHALEQWELNAARLNPSYAV